MNFAYGSIWSKQKAGRPPSAPWNRGGHVSVARTAAPTPFVDNGNSTLPIEESGLTVVPPRYRSILVPVNGDPFGEHALPLALGIARRARATVRVVYVHSPLQSAYPRESLYSEWSLDVYLRRQQEAYLSGLMRRLRRVTAVPVAPVFLDGGDVAEALSEAAHRGTDLVVLATHQRALLGRLWFGSVADVLMQRLPIPLLLVPGYDTPVDLTGDPLLRHILIPLDGSAVAEQVLEPALALGTLTGAAHTLLRVLTWTPDFSLGYRAAGVHRPLADMRRAEEWDYLVRVMNRLKSRNVRVHPRLVQSEETKAQAILDHARRHDVDLISLSTGVYRTQGQGRLARLIRGSVADRVIRGSSVPVLVCRADFNEGGSENPE